MQRAQINQDFGLALAVYLNVPSRIAGERSVELVHPPNPADNNLYNRLFLAL